MQFKRLFAIVLLATLAYVSSFTVTAQAADAPKVNSDKERNTTTSKGTPCNLEASSRGFVQSFYKWYLTKPESNHACKQRPSAFSPELLKMLNDDYAASQKVSGEIVGLDFDPFLDTNAEPFVNYVATNVTRKGENYLVQVDGKGGNRTDKSRIQPEVAYKNGKWQFVNFHYPGAKGTNENLLSILKTLRSDRRKNGIK
ncbi:MAG: hypothetical protein DKT66_26210 [Candidatus Melainabacteria bacterium]|nr:MAG: hypothetical protein DKT66_26210 [Candidatus Melainabacteria bacterium]